MRKFIPGNLIFVITGLLLFILSCTPESCFEETEAYLKATLYLDLGPGKAVKLQAPDSITVYGLNMETNKLYSSAKNTKVIKLPLNASATTSVFIIRINGVSDTLEFRYDNYPHLVSKECGYTYYHNLDTDRIYTRHKILGLHYYKRTITTLNEENIRIFY
jgi:hypothetical protein